MGRQGIILLAILIISVLIMAAAAYYAQRSQNPLASGASSRRFTAQPGTAREQATPLAIRKTPIEETPGAVVSPPSTTPEASVDNNESAIMEGEGGLAAPSDADLLIQSVDHLPDPVQGIEQIENALASEAFSAQDKARLHTAQGQMEARKIPPDLDAAAAAFEQAMTTAPDYTSRQAIVRDAARTLIAHGRLEAALAYLEAVRQEGAAQPPNATAMEIELLQAQVHEDSGQSPEAAALYRQLLDTAKQLGAPPGLKQEEMLRLAALRLARLYRAEGRDKEAEALARELQTILRPQGAAASSPGG